MKQHLGRVLIIMLLVGSAIAYFRSVYWLPQRDRGVNFLIGRWVLEDSKSSDQFPIKEMEFIDSYTLLCDIIKNEVNEYNVRYEYIFLGKNTIRIMAPRRLSSDWEVAMEGGFLKMNSEVWPVGTGVFRRGVNIDWLSVAILLGICIVGLFLVAPLRVASENQHMGLEESNLAKRKGVSRHLLRILANSAVFMMGIAAGVFIWTLPMLLRIRLPWDAIVILELSALVCLLGMKTIQSNPPVLALSDKSNWLSLVGVSLIGMSVPGIIGSLAKLIILNL